MPPAGRLGDKAQCPSDVHACPIGPHPTIGPAILGSPNVMINSRPAVRKTDTGIHAACCGPNMWTAQMASMTVNINSLGAYRLGDMSMHCGGVGQLIEGSTDVIIGG